MGARGRLREGRKGKREERGERGRDGGRVRNHRRMHLRCGMCSAAPGGTAGGSFQISAKQAARAEAAARGTGVCLCNVSHLFFGQQRSRRAAEAGERRLSHSNSLHHTHRQNHNAHRNKVALWTTEAIAFTHTHTHTQPRTPPYSFAARCCSRRSRSALPSSGSNFSTCKQQATHFGQRHSTRRQNAQASRVSAGLTNSAKVSSTLA